MHASARYTVLPRRFADKKRWCFKLTMGGWGRQVDEKRVIVFVNSKRACDIVYKQLDTLGYRCTVLHSGKTQARPWVSWLLPLMRNSDGAHMSIYPHRFASTMAPPAYSSYTVHGE